MADPGRTRRRRTGQALLSAAAGVAIAAHLVLLYLPGSATPQIGVPGLDKLVHAALFAVPTLLLALAVGRPRAVAVGFGLHALLSELVQAAFVPGRQGDPWDVVFDLLGVGLAMAVLAWRPVRSDQPG